MPDARHPLLAGFIFLVLLCETERQSPCEEQETLRVHKKLSRKKKNFRFYGNLNPSL
jgi:hypothetical protein